MNKQKRVCPACWGNWRTFGCEHCDQDGMVDDDDYETALASAGSNKPDPTVKTMKYTLIAYALTTVTAIATIVIANPPHADLWSLLAAVALTPMLLLTEKAAYTVCEFLTLLWVIVMVFAALTFASTARP